MDTSEDGDDGNRFQASLGPDPTQTSFIADGETWHPFTLSVTTALGFAGRYSDRVNVRIEDTLPC